MRIDVNDLLDPIKPLLTMPAEQIDQSVSFYEEGVPCCVGSHMANLLGVAAGHADDFLKGIDAWAELVGGNRAHAIVMLRQAGAGHNPLSAATWKLHPNTVFENLTFIEELPDLKGKRFDDQWLMEVDFSGMDLAGTRFDRADVRRSKFVECNLHQADFGLALASDADFSRATLTEANFQGAELYDTTFMEANMSGADLIDAYFQNTDTTGVDMTNVKIGQSKWKRASRKQKR